MNASDALDSLKKFFGSRGERKTSINGHEVLILDKDNERAVFIEEPRQVFHITANDVTTFIAYIKDIGAEYAAETEANYTNVRYGKNHPVMDELQVFFEARSGTNIMHPKMVVLTENQRSRHPSSIKLPLLVSEEITRWLNAGKMNQREFQQLLMATEGQHDAPHLAAILHVFSGTIQIDYTNSSSTERDYSFVYTEKDIAGQASIPRQIRVTCPIVGGFYGTSEFVFDIVLIRPKSENEKIAFRLELVGADFDTRFRQEALDIVYAELITPALEISSAFLHPIKRPKNLHTIKTNDSYATTGFVQDI